MNPDEVEIAQESSIANRNIARVRAEQTETINYKFLLKTREKLPAYKVKDEIVQMIKENQVGRIFQLFLLFFENFLAVIKRGILVHA